MKNGWIKIYRQIEDCALWEGEPYSRGQAWISLLLNANHRDKAIMFNGKETIVGRGQLLTSVRKLCQKFVWGKDKTLSFLRYLERNNMITKESDNHRTLLTIVKYEVYQGDADTDKDTDGYTDKDTHKDTDRYTDPPQTRNIKNVKNEKNKDIYAGNSTSDDCVKEIIDYLNEKTGKRYRSKTDATIKSIHGRISEGYTVDDFKMVIDCKVKEWTGTEYEKYLTPDTLFRPSKFEKYFNQSVKSPKKPLEKKPEEHLNFWDDD